MFVNDVNEMSGDFDAKNHAFRHPNNYNFNINFQITCSTFRVYWLLINSAQKNPQLTRYLKMAIQAINWTVAITVPFYRQSISQYHYDDLKIVCA